MCNRRFFLKKAQFTQYNDKDPPACKLLLSYDLAYVFSMKDNNSYYRFSLPKVLPLYTAFLCVPQETLVHLVVPSSSVMEQKNSESYLEPPWIFTSFHRISSKYSQVLGSISLSENILGNELDFFRLQSN